MEQTQKPVHCIIPIHKPDWKEYAFFFSSGILVSIPFTLFFAQAYGLFPAVLTIVVFAPFIEEFAKVLPLFYRHGETERSITVLAILTGLGFGIAEFVIYVAFLDVSPLARILGVIFHTSSAVVAAYGIVKKNPVPYYLVAVGLHMANNLVAVLESYLLNISLGVLILVVTYLLAWQYYHKASTEKIVT
jgi:hypothetical protein